MSDPREAKLPRWAQQLLQQERARADGAEGKLNAHLETVEPTGIWYGDWQNKIYIPDPFGYQQVYFSVTGEPAKASDEIRVRVRQGTLHVNASRGVVIEPIASNCFDVRMKD